MIVSRTNVVAVIGIFAVAGLVALLLGLAVHCGLNRCCVIHARRYCRRNALDIRRWTSGPAFDATGVKTEFTLVELDCLDDQQERRRVRLLVWLFGVRQVIGNEPYGEPE